MPYHGGNSILGLISMRHCHRLPYRNNAKIKPLNCWPRLLLHHINSVVLLFSSCVFLHYLLLIGGQPCIPTIKLQVTPSATIVSLPLLMRPLHLASQIGIANGLARSGSAKLISYTYVSETQLAKAIHSYVCYCRIYSLHFI